MQQKGQTATETALEVFIGTIKHLALYRATLPHFSGVCGDCLYWLFVNREC